MKGERRSVKRGASLEFADYRNYAPGDDLRRLDWKVYGRLDRPFLKLFEEEEDLAVHVLLDGSQSMDWGEGEQNKFHYASRLAAAFGVMALSAGDSLTVTVLRRSNAEGAAAPAAQFGPSRSQSNILPLLRFFESLTPGGPTDLTRSLRDYGMVARRPGLAFIISDLFTPGVLQESLAQLQGRGYEVVLLHLLAPDEIDPPLVGDLRLVDVETGQPIEVTVDAGLRRLYQGRLETWRDEIAATCRKRGVHPIALSTGQPWDEVIFEELRRAGVVK